MHWEFTYTRKRAANHYSRTHIRMRTIIVVVINIIYIYMYIYGLRRAHIILCAFPREIYHLIFFTILFLPPRVVNNALAYYYIHASLQFSRRTDLRLLRTSTGVFFSNNFRYTVSLDEISFPQSAPATRHSGLVFFPRRFRPLWATSVAYFEDCSKISRKRIQTARDDIISSCRKYSRYSKLSRNLLTRRLLGIVNNFKRLYLPAQYYSFDIFEPREWVQETKALYNALKPMFKTILLYDNHTNTVAASLVFIGKRYATK